MLACKILYIVWLWVFALRESLPPHWPLYIWGTKHFPSLTFEHEYAHWTAGTSVSLWSSALYPFHSGLRSSLMRLSVSISLFCWYDAMLDSKTQWNTDIFPGFWKLSPSLLSEITHSSHRGGQNVIAEEREGGYTIPDGGCLSDTFWLQSLVTLLSSPSSALRIIVLECNPYL